MSKRILYEINTRINAYELKITVMRMQLHDDVRSIERWVFQVGSVCLMFSI